MKLKSLVVILLTVVLYTPAYASEESVRHEEAEAAFLSGDLKKGLEIATPNIHKLYAPTIKLLATIFEAMGKMDLAFDYYLLAAEQGEPFSQFTVGMMYRDGDGTSVDHALALTWLQKAAHNGIHEAQFNVGLAYDFGRGVTKDSQQAFYWYKRSAEGGVALAQNNLAELYREGSQIEQNLPEAARWYKKAAWQNYSPSQLKLSMAYFQGSGVFVNRTESYAWIMLASAQGLDMATKLLTMMDNSLSESDISLGKLRAIEIKKQMVQ
jgi:TPR repeat protein